MAMAKKPYVLRKLFAGTNQVKSVMSAANGKNHCFSAIAAFAFKALKTRKARSPREKKFRIIGASSLRPSSAGEDSVKYGLGKTKRVVPQMFKPIAMAGIIIRMVTTLLMV